MVVGSGDRCRFRNWSLWFGIQVFVENLS